MNANPATVEDPSDPRFQDPRLRPDLLEFLRTKAFPTWDFFDTAERRELLRQYPSQRLGEDVARKIQDLGPFNTHLIPTTVLRPSVQVTATALRRPGPPRRRLLGGLERPDGDGQARDSGVNVFIVVLSALGPWSGVTWMWPSGGLDPPLRLATVESNVLTLLRDKGLTILSREELQVPVRGMKGTPYGKAGEIPNVYACLFDESGFRMRALKAKGLRFKGAAPGDLWPPMTIE